MFIMTTRRLLVRWAAPTLVVLALALAGCGDDADEGKAMPFDPAGGARSGDMLEAKVKKKKEKKGQVDVGEFVAKAEWDMLNPHFVKFVGIMEDDIHNRSVTWKYKDAFADRTEKFYPPEEAPKKPLVDLSKAAVKSPEKKKEEKTIASILDGIVPPGAGGSVEDVASEVTDTGPVSPLVLHTLDKYVFRIIMTGVSNPEALVEDPSGRTHVVHLNDKIGSEGGHVVDIFKHKVVIRLPDVPDPVEVTLSPDSLPDTLALP
jgi:hypothetical protein